MTSGEAYLLYKFNEDGTPSSACPVLNRKQASPSDHTVSIFLEGQTEIIHKEKGHVVDEGGCILDDQGLDLPVQAYCGPDRRIIMLENISPKRVSPDLPSICFKQYGDWRVKWKRLDTFVPMRDVISRKACVYMPVRVDNTAGAV